MLTRRKLLLGGLVVIAVLATIGTIMFRRERIPEAPPQDRRAFLTDPALDLPPPSAIRYLTQFGGEGVEVGQFRGPFGVHAAADGKVYAADDLGHEIHVFDRDGRF